MATKKEQRNKYGGLPQSNGKRPLPVNRQELVTSPSKEPRFNGPEYGILIRTLRKMGTLREKDKKRANLTKGLRIMSHIHERDGQGPSIDDIELVILDVYHGRLKDVFLQHKIDFFLDGIWTIEEAIRVLQNFSDTTITRNTEIDYLTFIPAFVFDEMEEQQDFLSLPVEQAMRNPRFAGIFYPSLCQSVAWHDLGMMDWIRLLENIGSITPEKAKAWRDYEIPGSQTTKGPAHFMGPNQMQELLDYQPDQYEEKMYQLCVLGNLEAFKERSVKTRYLLIPCWGSENSPDGHSYAVFDQAAGDTIVRWVDEQEADQLIESSSHQGWDQAYSYGEYLNDHLLCPDCQK